MKSNSTKYFAVIAFVLVVIILKYAFQYSMFFLVGSSMYPNIKYGDIVICESVHRGGKCNVGDACIYIDENGKRILHRVIEIRDSFYVFKGDNNVAPDGLIPAQMVVCRVVAVIPRHLWATAAGLLLPAIYVASERIKKRFTRAVLIGCCVAVIIPLTLAPWFTSTIDITKPSTIPIIREARVNDTKLQLYLENAELVENVDCKAMISSSTINCRIVENTIEVSGAVEHVTVFIKLRSNGYSATVILYR